MLRIIYTIFDCKLESTKVMACMSIVNDLWNIENEVQYALHCIYIYASIECLYTSIVAGYVCRKQSVTIHLQEFEPPNKFGKITVSD